MKLSELKNGNKAVIVKVKGHGAFRKRITEMGFIKGQNITVVKDAPLKDPVEYQIMGYEVSLRRSEANLIEVITPEEALSLQEESFNGVITDDLLKTTAGIKGKTIHVALVGNPNAGKTTLFNHASNSHESVGNYSGVTVDAKVAEFQQNGYTFKITDLPGTYSATAYSPEELYVRQHITNNVPDVIINVVDASNLERNLYLTTQLIDMDIKVIVALNMYDELQQKGAAFDYQAMGKMLGIPFVPTVSSKGKGIKELFDKVIDVYSDNDDTLRHIHINYGSEMEKAIKKIQWEVVHNKSLIAKYSARFISIKLLEKDKVVAKIIEECSNYETIKKTAELEIQRLEKEYEEDTETLVTDSKYGFIAGALKETYKAGKTERRKTTEAIDNVVTHRLWGFPIFILFMWVMFQSTFSLGEYPMGWIESLVALLGDTVREYMPDGMLKALIVNGIIDGVGGVIVFLPNIVILFFFISFMEDTGYMARVAFIMDKIMHRIGLHGKSFIPLVMGFGCNVPAIMATRTLENRNDRLLTMLINPFMSCSARLPVYVLITGAFFAENAGTVLFSIYIFGIFMAIVAALLLKKLFFKSKEAPFVMELPPYRIPTAKSTLKHMWSKAVQYLKKMGGVIMVASVIIWALGYFPRSIQYDNNYEQLAKTTTHHYDSLINTVAANDTAKINLYSIDKHSVLKAYELAKESERQEKSYIGRIGKFMEPIMRPLGFDWKMSVSILTGIAAKEIVVSTMGVLYQAETEAETESLQKKLQNEVYRSGDLEGQPVYTKITALAFLMFILIYFPCVAVVAAINKESGSWKWAMFTVIYTTGIAWLVAFLVNQIGGILF